MTLPGKSHEQTIAEVYDHGAANYEKYWAPALHRHALALVDTLPPPPSGGRLVVDVATGAGTLVPALREVAGRAGRVLALDRSIGMLARASHREARVQADACQLPIADATADAVVHAFVLFMLPDARRALREATRVLRPGGWILTSTWGGGDEDTRADDLVRKVLDAAGAPAFDAPPRSDDLTDTPEKMVALLEAHGFTDVQTQSRPLDARFEPASFVDMRLGMGELGWRQAQLDGAAQAAVREELLRRVGGLPGDALLETSEVILSTARR